MAREIFAKDPQKFVPALAEALKKVPEFQAPEWVMIVKTGVSKERPTTNKDFWYTRAASILRQLYIKGVVGVNRLRTRYGGKKNRGGKRSKFFKAGGKIIRVILQQAEAAGLVEKIKGQQFGRRLTQKGRDFLDSIEVEKTQGIDLSDIIVKEKKFEQYVEEENSDNEEVEESNEELNEGEEDGKETQ